MGLLQNSRIYFSMRKSDEIMHQNQNIMNFFMFLLMNFNLIYEYETIICIFYPQVLFERFWSGEIQKSGCSKTLVI